MYIQWLTKGEYCMTSTLFWKFIITDFDSNINWTTFVDKGYSCLVVSFNVVHIEYTVSKKEAVKLLYLATKKGQR